MSYRTPTLETQAASQVEAIRKALTDKGIELIHKFDTSGDYKVGFLIAKEEQWVMTLLEEWDGRSLHREPTGILSYRFNSIYASGFSGTGGPTCRSQVISGTAKNFKMNKVIDLLVARHDKIVAALKEKSTKQASIKEFDRKLDALLTKYPRFKDYIYVEDGLLRFQFLGFSPDHADRILALFSDELLNEIEADEDEDEE
jgi:hypothetical protein